MQGVGLYLPRAKRAFGKPPVTLPLVLPTSQACLVSNPILLGAHSWILAPNSGVDFKAVEFVQSGAGQRTAYKCRCGKCGRVFRARPALVSNQKPTIQLRPNSDSNRVVGLNFIIQSCLELKNEYGGAAGRGKPILCICGEDTTRLPHCSGRMRNLRASNLLMRKATHTQTNKKLLEKTT